MPYVYSSIIYNYYLYTHYIYIYISLHTIEYYSALKKNEVLPFATWMELEGTMLSEISQTEKDKCFMMSLTCGL